MHNTPVIGPRDGLVGDLIRRYQLGLTLDTVNPHSLAELIDSEKECKISNRYAKERSIVNFTRVVLSR